MHAPRRALASQASVVGDAPRSAAASSSPAAAAGTAAGTAGACDGDGDGSSGVLPTGLIDLVAAAAGRWLKKRPPRSAPPTLRVHNIAELA